MPPPPPSPPLPHPQAYEFTLDRLGQDSACGSIWLDYITFLTAPRQGSPEYAAIYGEALEGQVGGRGLVGGCSAL